MAYSHYRTITVDHTLVPNTTQSNFPMLVSGTYSYLATTGNGGLVTNSNGYDIAFFSDSGLTTQLKHETEKYVATTGEVVYWVKIPTLSYTSDTVIYIAYGDSGVTTDQSDKTNVWDSDYQVVFHLPDGTTLGALDSTSNANNGTITGATATTGQIGGGAIYSASNNKIVSGLTAHNNTRTYSMWTYRTGEGGNNLGRLIEKRTGSDAQVETFYNLYADTKYQFERMWSTNGQWKFIRPSANTWSYVVVTYDSSSSANVPLAYIDGVSQTITTVATPSGTLATNTSNYVIGNRSNDNARVWAGSLDEVRISNTIRSGDWIATEYNNQSTPSTFYAVGSQQTTGGGGGSVGNFFLGS